MSTRGSGNHVYRGSGNHVYQGGRETMSIRGSGNHVYQGVGPCLPGGRAMSTRGSGHVYQGFG
ncbi:hypothetical protein DPMN_165546 [Dreissena polymorpha]|uniref:Uncharacterized protein n=1 Tax=Dreissena polymorpha TaxID=45954 RepID=A0A9D4EWA9_DREPO|nr:hypothetical protein DPMN_165546 [Dreissena polymorpha]